MNVAVKPAVERPEFRARQDEGLGDLGSLQESVQIIHHPGEQQQLRFMQFISYNSASMKVVYKRPILMASISYLLVHLRTSEGAEKNTGSHQTQ